MSISVIRRSEMPHRSSSTPRFSAITFSTVPGRLRGRGCRSGSLGMSLRRRTKEAGSPAAASAGRGDAQGVHVVEEPEDAAGQPQPGVGGHLAGPHLVRQPVGERDDVLAAERGGIVRRRRRGTGAGSTDSTAAARMVSRAESAGYRPRRRGRSSAAHHLTASRSHRWLMPVKSSLPGSPRTRSCQTSLARSLSGPDSRQYSSDVSDRSSSRASGRISAPGTWARSSTLAACRACSSLTR